MSNHESFLFQNWCGVICEVDRQDGSKRFLNLSTICEFRLERGEDGVQEEGDALHDERSRAEYSSVRQSS